ncbi:hypothetical protein H2684_01730 [Clostridium sp. cel8]|jgi:hypothetical protein|uniref:hypothetical protein n=1 Tax=Clostridium sp. cel8 TaxID=2663123 RepID=UPI0015F5BB8A|nr:hypothetical protein [Clostridium sp. cel8]MBA5850038.1 hypothetical protein [Clostridium sp. cel8]
MANIKFNVKKVIVLIIILIVAAIAAFFSLLFSNSSYSVKEYKFSQTIFDKIIEMQKAGSVVYINQDELNGVIYPIIGGTRTSGNITVKGINAEIKDSTIKFYIPLKYKNFNLLATTEGSVYLKDKQVVYDVNYFKIGKISFPKSYVMDKLSSKLNNDDIKIQGNTFRISEDIIPANMDSIYVKNSKLVINVSKNGMSSTDKLKWIENIIKSPENLKKIEEYINGAVSDSTTEQSKEKSSEESNESESTSDNSENSVAENSVSNSSSNSTAQEQAVASKIVSAINNKDKAALISAQSEYNNLSPEGKARVQSSVKSQLSPATIAKIKEKLGK